MPGRETSFFGAWNPNRELGRADGADSAVFFERLAEMPYLLTGLLIFEEKPGFVISLFFSATDGILLWTPFLGVLAVELVVPRM